jgi:multidrug efflux system membrane fusion protein
MSTFQRLAIAMALAGTLGTVVTCGRGPAREKTARPVRVETVRAQGTGGGLRYSATVQPSEQVALAFKVGGYVREVLQRPGVDGRPRDVQQGDAVVKGTVLARVTETDYQEKVRQAQAQLAEAEAALVKAQADAERAEALYQSRSLTRPDYDGARAARDAAQARTDAAKAQLAAAEIALRDCALVAPIDGVVLSRSVEVGTLAGAGTLGFTIADLGRVKAVFGVPDTLIGRVKTGAPLSVTSDALGSAEFPGRITAVAPAADAQSRVFTVEVTIPNPEQQLKVGMVVTVEVASPSGTESTAGLLAVSVSAIVKSPRTTGGYAVFLADGKDERTTAKARDVGLGAISGNRVGVTTGLAPGDRVIVSGASLLTDGDSVRVIPGESE